MTRDVGAFEHQATALLERRMAQLRQLSFADVAALPETSSEEIVVAGRKCSLNVFVQSLAGDQLLLVLMVARPAWFGMISFHTERGLVFAREGAVREATPTELMESGG